MTEKITFLAIFLLIVLTSLTSGIWAQTGSEPSQEEILEGKVIDLLKEDVLIQAGKQYLYQKLKVLITHGSLKGKEVVVEVGNVPLVGQPKYQPGDEVLLTYTPDPEGNDLFYITDYIRRRSLLFLSLLFVGLSLLVGRWQGVASVLGLGVSFLVIFFFVLPKFLLVKIQF